LSLLEKLEQFKDSMWSRSDFISFILEIITQFASTTPICLNLNEERDEAKTEEVLTPVMALFRRVIESNDLLTRSHRFQAAKFVKKLLALNCLTDEFHQQISVVISDLLVDNDLFVRRELTTTISELFLAYSFHEPIYLDIKQKLQKLLPEGVYLYFDFWQSK